MGQITFPCKGGESFSSFEQTLFGIWMLRKSIDVCVNGFSWSTTMLWFGFQQTIEKRVASAQTTWSSIETHSWSTTLTEWIDQGVTSRRSGRRTDVTTQGVGNLTYQWCFVWAIIYLLLLHIHSERSDYLLLFSREQRESHNRQGWGHQDTSSSSDTSRIKARSQWPACRMQDFGLLSFSIARQRRTVECVLLNITQVMDYRLVVELSP